MNGTNYNALLADAKSKGHIKPNVEAKERVMRSKKQHLIFTETKKLIGSMKNIPTYTQRFMGSVDSLISKAAKKELNEKIAKINSSF